MQMNRVKSLKKTLEHVQAAKHLLHNAKECPRKDLPIKSLEIAHKALAKMREAIRNNKII